MFGIRHRMKKILRKMVTASAGMKTQKVHQFEHLLQYEIKIDVYKYECITAVVTA
jgi:hypothetical protein